MKTSVIITRKLGEFDVLQRTKDSMFNATTLLKQWNETSGQKKQMSHFMENDSTKQYIAAIQKDQKSKERNSVVIQRRGKSGGTWMCPYLFIDFAMWLNPTFKLDVIKFVYDQLIQHRIASGDNYNKLCSALSRFPDTDFREVGKILNYVVFNNHVKEHRNVATLEQQNDLQELERDMCKYVDMGFIKSYGEFKHVARKEWRKRHQSYPSIFNAVGV